MATAALFSCGGQQTFNEYARAGDTIAFAAGMEPDLSKNNVTVTITPSVGADIILNPGDPAIRGIVNLYPDPASSLIVSRETDQDITPTARTYAQTTNFTAGGDKDWFQSTVFIDLPATLPTGTTQIEVTNGLGSSHTSTLEIIPGTGTPHNFNGEFLGPLSADMFESLSRVSHFTVSFTAATLPEAIEINLTHDPDVDNGGVGRAFAINPTGYKKNLMWTDDGINMKAIILPARDGIFDDEQDYKFYVAGNITGLVIADVTGYDNNGAVVAGVAASITQSN